MDIGFKVVVIQWIKKYIFDTNDYNDNKWLEMIKNLVNK